MDKRFWFSSSFDWLSDELKLIYSLIISKLYNILGTAIQIWRVEYISIFSTEDYASMADYRGGFSKYYDGWQGEAGV